ncbi:uncharacterized protein JN550_008445 [Neoarthrinium moseri]|uniref:uncharacterized protein n=1 Tax=Neoarthrinium moseri TaxID=1658444 RepID=UPI001FDD2C58|nr:uncharacterized protein JN550_008445 [Neoarthrinium moseri]KAI1865397.1 hypothetical protein JN550_008445 [Neoarthrinium moseri]
MKTSALYAGTVALLSLLPSGVLAQVRLPFGRHSAGVQDGHAATTRQRRSFPVPLFSAEGTYVVNATVGTPPQNVSFALTVSADESWVPDAQYCHASYRDCLYGSFNHNESSTFVRPGTGSFSAYYQDDTYAYGDRIRETIGFPGGPSVTNLTMGLAQQTDLWLGVMALGYNDSYSVANIPDRLLAEGLINSTAYSMWLDEEDAVSGQLLLGAVDKSAYDGTLKRISAPRNQHIIEDDTTYTQISNTFDVYIQAVNASKSSDPAVAPLIQNTTAMPLVTIDPTFTISVLPEDLATAMWTLAGATYSETYDAPILPCSYRNNTTAHISLQLDSVGVDGGPVLNVPLSDLVLPEDTWTRRIWDYDTDTRVDWCLFGVQSINATSYSSYRNSWTLGAGMLKRQYVVFDLANEDIAMAPVKWLSAQTGPGEDVVPFSTYGAMIPGSTGNTSKCYADDDDCSSSRSSHGSGSGSSSGSDESVELERHYIGMIAGFSVLGAVMLGIAIWGIVQCCRDSNKYGPDGALTEKGSLEPEAASAQNTSASPQQEVGQGETSPPTAREQS